MRIAMEYHIIAGKSIETRRCWMIARKKGKSFRGTRIAGNTSAKKIAANERDAVRRAARTLNANFWKGFLLVTLKYSDARLPADYDAAAKECERFMRKARAAHRKTTGAGLQYFSVTANWSPRRQAPARLHHHVVMDMASLDMLSQLWPEGEIYVDVIRQPGDLSRLASYLLANVVGRPGKKKYSCSKGMEKPIATEPVEVDDVEGVEPLQGAYVIDGAPTYDEDGRVIGGWLLQRVDEPPKVRGSMVVLPKRRKKRRHEDSEYMAAVTARDE